MIVPDIDKGKRPIRSYCCGLGLVGLRTQYSVLNTQPPVRAALRHTFLHSVLIRTNVCYKHGNMLQTVSQACHTRAQLTPCAAAARPLPTALQATASTACAPNQAPSPAVAPSAAPARSAAATSAAVAARRVGPTTSAARRGSLAAAETSDGAAATRGGVAAGVAVGVEGYLLLQSMTGGGAGAGIFCWMSRRSGCSSIRRWICSPITD